MITAPRPLTVADTGADLRISILADAWIAINALGGVAPQGDEHARGFNDGIGAALDILERLGGFEPGAILSRDLQRAA